MRERLFDVSNSDPQRGSNFGGRSHNTTSEKVFILFRNMNNKLQDW